LYLILLFSLINILKSLKFLAGSSQTTVRGWGTGNGWDGGKLGTGDGGREGDGRGTGGGWEGDGRGMGGGREGDGRGGRGTGGGAVGDVILRNTQVS
jgi:hypothetical protein